MMKLRIYTVKNETQPVISNRSNIRATQRILIEKKKKRKTYIIVRNQAICSVIHTKVNAIQIQLQIGKTATAEKKSQRLGSSFI